MTRGPYSFPGYYKSPVHNAASFGAKSFYCSWDLIEINERDYITVQGREKDQINRDGKKIAAEDRALLNDIWGPSLNKQPDQQKIVDTLTPNDKDQVLTKWRYSAFVHSPLESILQEMRRSSPTFMPTSAV